MKLFIDVSPAFESRSAENPPAHAELILGLALGLRECLDVFDRVYCHHAGRLYPERFIEWTARNFEGGEHRRKLSAGLVQTGLLDKAIAKYEDEPLVGLSIAPQAKAHPFDFNVQILHDIAPLLAPNLAPSHGDQGTGERDQVRNRRITLARSLDRAALIVCPSEAVWRDHERLFAQDHSAPAIIARPGCLGPDFAQAQARWGSEEHAGKGERGAPYIVIAPGGPLGNLEVLSAAMQRFGTAFEGAHFHLFLTDGPAPEALQSRHVTASPLSDIETLRGALYRSRGLILPQLRDATGRWVLEATRLGQPVLVAATGAGAELADLSGSVLFDPQDPVSLAQAFIEFSALPRSPSDRIALAKRAASGPSYRSFAQSIRHSIQQVVAGTLSPTDPRGHFEALAHSSL